MFAASGRILALGRTATLLVCAVLLAACQTSSSPAVEEAEDEPPATPPPELDTVSLTIYLRTGSGIDAMLEPVSREVAAEGRLAQRAAELLFDGPTDDEDLEPPWPHGIAVRSVEVDGGVATVDLANDALNGQAPLFSLPHLEALALASLANTLTELPTVDAVRLQVGGRLPAEDEELLAAWGGWGLPPMLSRDETLIGEDGGSPLPALEDFTTDRQEIGSRSADPVHVRSIRVRDRITYVRVAIEIADAVDHDKAASDFPRAYVRNRLDQVILEVYGVDSMASDVSSLELDERFAPFLSSIEVERGQRADSMRVELTSPTEGHRRIYLHTNTSPTRIQLDIRK